MLETGKCWHCEYTAIRNGYFSLEAAMKEHWQKTHPNEKFTYTSHPTTADEKQFLHKEATEVGKQ